MLTAIVMVLLVLGFVLYVSRKADVEGAQYSEAVASNKTGAVMIEDQIDYTDPALIERENE